MKYKGDINMSKPSEDFLEVMLNFFPSKRSEYEKTIKDYNEVLETVIFEAAKWDGKVVVALKTDFDGGCDNVYCYSVNGTYYGELSRYLKNLE